MTYTNDTLHTACCLWEAALEALERGARAERGGVSPLDEPCAGFDLELYHRRVKYGTASLRLEVAELAPHCDAAWDALPEDDRDTLCFDWDFVPVWLRSNFFKLKGF